MIRPRNRWTALALATALAGAGWLAIRADRLPSHRESARLAIERRDFDSARDHLRRYLDEHPEDAEALLIAARTARRAGDRDAARSLLARCESAGTPVAEIQFERELLAIGAGNAALAKEHLAAVRSDPASDRSMLSLEAVIEAALNHDATGGNLPLPEQSLEGTAVPHLREALDLWFAHSLDAPARAHGLVWRARLRELTGEHAAALDDLREAVAMEPDRKMPRLLFALFRRQEAPDESRAALRQLAAQHPDDPAVQTAWAESLRDAGRLVEARAALARFPEHMPGVFLQARVALDQEKPAEAEPLLKRVLDAAPRSADAHAAMSRCLRQLGRHADAARHQDLFLELEREKQVPK